MKKSLLLMTITLAVSACGAPPAQPGGLWDALPASEGDGAKTVPSKIWDGAGSDSPEGPSVNVSTEPPADVRGAVVLNEVFYDSTESDTDGHLFVELFGEAGLDIGGCKIAFVNGADGGIYETIAIPLGAKIKDDGYYVVADGKTGSSAESNVDGADLVDTFDPQNGPDAVQFLDSQGNLVDALGYGEGILPTSQNGLTSFEGAPAADVAGGHSLERKTPGVDTDDNASDFTDRSDPTPGFGSAPESWPPETLPDYPDPEDPAPLDPEPVDPPAEPDSIPEPAGQVVLNEIFYDAVGTDTDGVLFVELFGTAGMDVGNYKIDFVDGADGSVDDVLVLPEGARLRDNGYYLIADAKNGLPSESNVAGVDFIDNFDPANGPDSVRLFDAQDDLVDAVGYGIGVSSLSQDGFPDFETAPAPDAASGHSLERRSAGFDTDDNFGDFLDREAPTPGW